MLTTFTASLLAFPTGVAVDDRAGLLYVSQFCGSLYVFNLQGDYKGNVPGLSLSCLEGVAVSLVTSNVYVTDGKGGAASPY